MAFPNVTSPLGVFGGDAGPGLTDHLITFPAYNPGDRMLIVFAGSGSGFSTDITVPAGWTPVTGNGGINFALQIFERRMTGTEGLTLTVTSAGAMRCCWFTLVIDGNVGSAAISVVATAAAGNTPDPAALTPPWDASVRETLWIALYVAGTAASNMTVWPLPDDQDYNRYLGAAPTVNMGVCTQGVLTPTLDPGAFLTNLNNNWLAWTLAYTADLPAHGFPRRFW